MNPKTRHPFDDVIYELTEDGQIRLTTDNAYGLFHQDGRWIAGEIRQCDPQMCVWIGNRPDPTETIGGTPVPRRHTIEAQD